ncbi:MAG: hypothetical protein JOZ30_07175, partial [Hyphomicrobiales bacterium]|nr:hypothetical protein [Hyphomicrobiales bacterium]
MPFPSRLPRRAQSASIGVALTLALSCSSSLVLAQASATSANPAQSTDAPREADRKGAAANLNATQTEPRRGVTPEAGGGEELDITVTAARLDVARDQINTAVGAS